MNGSYTGNPGARVWEAGAGLWSAMEQLRRGAERRGPAPGSERGDLRSAVLSVLMDGPMPGSQVLRAIEGRSDGIRRPTPGSVYPMLQLLADEGLVTAEESTGRRTYALTDTGRTAAQLAAAEPTTPWDEPRLQRAGRRSAIPKAGVQLAQAAAQVAQNGSTEQITAATAVLDEARRKLYAILAES